MKQESPHPQWALACKRKGTELRRLNGKYYLYEVTSKWNAQKKRSVKITGKLLGRITEKEGFIESDKARLRRQQGQITELQVKEYGIAKVIDTLFAETITALEQYFPDTWRTLVALSYGRLAYQSPMKNMFFHYINSYLSEQYGEVNLSAGTLSNFLRETGRDRERIVSFCRSFKLAEDCILFDGTDIFSHSKKLELSKYSKSKFGTYDDMVNLMCLFSVGRQSPVYYRLLPGNIKDVSAFKLSLQESGVKDATIIIDKGFASKSNIKALEKEELKYIIPLPRNSSLIDYEKLKSGDKRLFDGYFQYEGRYIWYYTTPIDEKKSIHIFLDEQLRNQEEKDYLDRIEKKTNNYSIEKFYDKRHTFGSIALISNTGKTAQQTYVDYKTRGEVETMIDALKNILDADRTYMQNPQALEGWMFINLIALKWYYILLNLLKKHKLNHQYSPADFLLYLSEIKMVKINGSWQLAEITQKTQLLLQKLNILPITYNT
jgi:hypothetical protein